MNVVFDFGAVLFTWRPTQLVTLYFPERARTVAQAGHLAHQIFGHADWQAFDRGALEMREVIDRTSTRLELAHETLSALVEGIGDRLTPMPDSVDLLTHLHGLRVQMLVAGEEPLKLYFLSNMPVPYARTLERRHDLLAWFDGGIFSGDVLLVKPEPAIYQLLQSRYGLLAQSTVFIDDLLGNVQAAQGLGWHGIHFKTAKQAASDLEALGLASWRQ